MICLKDARARTLNTSYCRLHRKPTEIETRFNFIPCYTIFCETNVAEPSFTLRLLYPVARQSNYLIVAIRINKFSEDSNRQMTWR